MKSKILGLGLLTVAVFVSMTALYSVSRRLLQQDNAFARVFPPHRVGSYRGMDLRFNSYYFAGLDSPFIYLGNGSNPGHLLKLDYSLRDSTPIAVEVPYTKDSVPTTLQWIVEGSQAWLVDLADGTIQETTLDSPRLKAFTHQPSTHFSQFLPVSDRLSFITANDYILDQRVLRSLTFADSVVDRDDHFVLDKQEEGWFSTSGMLCYDSSQSVLVYVYHYLNRVLYLDTNLQLLHRGHTIDTIVHGQLQVVDLPAEHTRTLTGHQPIVNRSIAADRGMLYVNSGLQASNEHLASFQKNATIDAYSIPDGYYHFSFYLPMVEGKKIKSFLVNYPYVVALYERSIGVFELDPKR